MYSQLLLLGQERRESFKGFPLEGMKEIHVKFCVGLVDTERPVDLTLMSLLVGADVGNVVCKAIPSRVVLWGFFCFPLGERLINCGTDELHEFIEIYWLSP